MRSALPAFHWRRKSILTVLFTAFCLCGIAQVQRDTLKKDSTRVYRNIEEFSNKRKITRYIYEFFFRPLSNTPQKVEGEKVEKKTIVNTPSIILNGKIIRHIYITTLDPFGCSVCDSTETHVKFIYRTGNALHVNTRQRVIRNLLLIHKNKAYDSLLVKESERLIRAQTYVHEVAITARPIRKGSDSVDVFVRVLDTWSIVGSGAFTQSDFSVDLEERNFLGLGHDLKTNFYSNVTNGHYTYKANYLISNIRNTYISTALHYQADEKNNRFESVSIDRPFFSPYAKWAAGAYVGQSVYRQPMQIADSLFLQNYRVLEQDYWAGYGHRILRGNSENARTTNWIVSGRFAQTKFAESPAKIYDTLGTFETNDLYLARIGIGTRKYIQDKYIFNYGRTEDVPVGMVYSVTGGYNVKGNLGRVYLGMRVGYGNYTSLGFLSTNMEYGTFLRSGNFEQGIFSVGFNYFTKLFQIGKWKLRQFVKPRFVRGIDRLPNESLNINNENGIRGFSSAIAKGDQKLVLTFQTQLYPPWRVLGFRFGPYFVLSLGMLGNETSGFMNSKVYSQIGAGLLIKNDFLVFSNMQISIAYYPTIPGSGNNIFKTNPDKASDFGFQDFDIGKPAVVYYQ